MAVPYEVIAEIEILSEMAAYITSDYRRYMREHGIDMDDKNNPFVRAAAEAWDYKDKMLNECKTLDSLAPIERRLQELKGILLESGAHERNS